MSMTPTCETAKVRYQRYIKSRHFFPPMKPMIMHRFASHRTHTQQCRSVRAASEQLIQCEYHRRGTLKLYVSAQGIAFTLEVVQVDPVLIH